MKLGPPALLTAALFVCSAVVGCGQGGDEGGFSAASADPLAAAPASLAASRTPGDLETELLRRVNEYRVARGLNVLIDSSAMRDVARAHSFSMWSDGYFAHESPDGLSAGDRLTAAGVAWTISGENLAKNLSVPEAVFMAWLGSPEHRANLEAEEWTHAGVGWVSSALHGGSHHVTLLFVRP